MKKILALVPALLAIVAPAALPAQSGLPEVSVQGSLRFESEHIFRGIKKGGTTFIPGASIGFSGFYGGAESFNPVSDSNANNQLDVFLGWRDEVAPDFVLDVGGTYKMYPDSDRQRNRELYVGVELQGLGSSDFWSELYPRFYAFYDLDRQNGTFFLVGAVRYDIFLDDTTWLRLEPFLGWGRPDQGRDWLFYGTTLDLNYALYRGFTASVGVRYSGKDRTGGFLGTNSDNFWWGARLNFEF